MGWLFSSSWASRKELLEHLRSPSRFGSGFTLLRSQAVGNHHWYVCELADGRRFIGLDLMQGGRDHGWGYKDLDETCGPCEVDCPISYLDVAGGTPTGSAIDWRKSVRAFHVKQATLKLKLTGLAPGMRITYGGQEYELLRPYTKGNWKVRDTASFEEYRMHARQLKKALLRQISEAVVE